MFYSEYTGSKSLLVDRIGHTDMQSQITLGLDSYQFSVTALLFDSSMTIVNKFPSIGLLLACNTVC